MSGQDFGFLLFKKATQVPVREEGTKAGVAELQAFAHEELMKFFLVLILLCPPWPHLMLRALGADPGLHPGVWRVGSSPLG